MRAGPRPGTYECAAYSQVTLETAATTTLECGLWPRRGLRDRYIERAHPTADRAWARSSVRVRVGQGAADALERLRPRTPRTHRLRGDSTIRLRRRPIAGAAYGLLG